MQAWQPRSIDLTLETAFRLPVKVSSRQAADSAESARAGKLALNNKTCSLARARWGAHGKLAGGLARVPLSSAIHYIVKVAQSVTRLGVCLNRTHLVGRLESSIWWADMLRWELKAAARIKRARAGRKVSIPASRSGTGRAKLGSSSAPLARRARPDKPAAACEAGQLRAGQACLHSNERQRYRVDSWERAR